MPPKNRMKWKIEMEFKIKKHFEFEVLLLSRGDWI